MAKDTQQQGGIFKQVAGIVSLFVIVLGLCIAGDAAKLDKDVYKEHCESQTKQFKSTNEKQNDNHQAVIKSLDKIEKKLGIYEPE
jgi:hypothetical protein